MNPLDDTMHTYAYVDEWMGEFYCDVQLFPDEANDLNTEAREQGNPRRYYRWLPMSEAA